MWKDTKTNYFYVIILFQSFLGVVFIFSGFAKIINVQSFSEALINFKLFSIQIINITKYAIPIIEIILGFCIIFNFNSSFPSFLSSLLLSFFTALIIAKLFEGEEISCGCFGTYSNNKLDLYSVLRNVFLILISFIVSIYYESNKLNKNSKDDIRKSIRIILLVNITFYLASQDLIFAMQNMGLKSRLSSLLENENILKNGEKAKNFTVFSTSKEKINIQYSQNLSKKTLLFILKPSCTPCKLNLQNWEKIYFEIDTFKIRVFPVLLDRLESTLKYSLEYKLSFPIYYVEDSNFLADYKIYLTPQTILIDKKG